MSQGKNNLPQDNLQTFLKYIGLSFQLFAVIGLGTLLGWYIQQQSQMKFPIWLLLFSFLGVIVAFYQLFVQMKNDQKREEKHKNQ
ncbi:AtpZ/AtpI family protein [Indibacter alkaliphilus]|nr:AtpZ/AtpI family protein [Indibacter alkaliphilus]